MIESAISNRENIKLTTNNCKMTRAYNALFEIISIDSINDTNRDNCFCIGCGCQLSAKLGVVNAHHFAHRPEHLKPSMLTGFNPELACSWSHECELHIIAKEYIENVMKLSLPIGTINPMSKVIEFDTVELERNLNGRVPDIITTVNGERVLIEIAVTHKCDASKIIELRNNNLNCIEIDLSSYKRAGDVINHEQVKQLITRANAKWLSVSTSNQFGKAIHEHDKAQLKEAIREFMCIDGKSNSAMNNLRAEYKERKDNLEADISKRKKELELINSDIDRGGVDIRRCQFKLKSINENIEIASKELNGIADKIADIDANNLISREQQASRNEKLNYEENNRLVNLSNDIKLRLKDCEVREQAAARITMEASRAESHIANKSISLDAKHDELDRKIKAAESISEQAEETLNKRMKAIDDDARRAEEAINKRIKNINEEVNREARIIVERMYAAKLNEANSALKIVTKKVKDILNKTRSVLPIKIRNEILEMIK